MTGTGCGSDGGGLREYSVDAAVGWVRYWGVHLRN